MTKQANFKFTRRDLLKGGGALVVTFGMPGWAVAALPFGVEGVKGQA